MRVECISAVRKSELLLVLFVDVRDRLIRGNFVFVDRREYAYKEVRGTNEIGKTFIIRNKIKISRIIYLSWNFFFERIEKLKIRQK